MDLNIVIRAADPVRATELLGRLGIELEEPNRPNPTRWHAWRRISISVEQCGSGDEPGLALAVPEFERALSGTSAVATDGRNGGWTPVDLGGAVVPFLADAGAVARPAGDEALLAYAETILQRVRRELAGILARHRSIDARLAGPAMLGLHPATRRFALVVGGSDDDAMEELRSLLDAHALPTFKIEVVAAEELDREAADRVDRLAWDLHL